MYRKLLICLCVSSLTACVFEEMEPEAGDVATEGSLGTSQLDLGAPNGIRLTNGLRLTNGIRLTNGATLVAELDLSKRKTSGTAGDIDLSGSGVLDGETVRYFNATTGSSLEKWIDVDPANQTRILKYLVECAFSSGTKVRVKYKGAVTTYLGTAGLAPYTSDPMLGANQEALSACILARVNYSGAMVNIDMFGKMPGFTQAADLAEITTTYGFSEAAFFGNLFLPTPETYACAANNNGSTGFLTDTRGFRACSPDISGKCMVTPIDCGRITAANDPTAYQACLQHNTVTLSCEHLGFTRQLIVAPNNTNKYYYTKITVNKRDWNYPITVRTALITRDSADKRCYSSSQCAPVAGKTASCTIGAPNPTCVWL